MEMINQLSQSGVRAAQSQSSDQSGTQQPLIRPLWDSKKVNGNLYLWNITERFNLADEIALKARIGA